MKEYKLTQIVQIFSVAENILNDILMLPELLEKHGVVLPTSVYDGTRKGGYLAIYQRSKLVSIIEEPGELLMLGKIGEIDDKEDEDWGCKSNKYKNFADSKCQSIIQTPFALTSDETSFKIKGGLAMNDKLVIGFSGRSQWEDELLVVATAMYSEIFLEEHRMIEKVLPKLRAKNNNPLLSEKILHVVGNKYRDIK